MDQVAVGRIGGRALANLAREGLGAGPVDAIPIGSIGTNPISSDPTASWRRKPLA
jgi:hypothetical protein